jgi:integrase/recombinase XerD
LFTEYYAKYLAEIRLRPNEYGAGVIGHYVKAQTHLMRFLKVNGWQKIKLNELSCRFIERYVFYLLTTANAQTGRPMNSNTMTTYVRKLKAVVNSAWRKQIIPTNPFATYKLAVLRPVNKVVLTKEERLRVRRHDLGGNLALQKVRDCFLFCCETGLRHSDAVQLMQNMITIDDQGMYWITLRQVKTKDVLDIPMTKAAVEIFKRFESHRKSTGYVLPMLTNQKVNAHLKVIADLTGITKRLTFHAARHTFATSALEDGMDIASVSALLGHRSIKTTQIYAKMTRTRKAEVIRQLDKRRNNQISSEGLSSIPISLN